MKYVFHILISISILFTNLIFSQNNNLANENFKVFSKLGKNGVIKNDSTIIPFIYETILYQENGSFICDFIDKIGVIDTLVNF